MISHRTLTTYLLISILCMSRGRSDAQAPAANDSATRSIIVVVAEEQATASQIHRYRHPEDAKNLEGYWAWLGTGESLELPPLRLTSQSAEVEESQHVIDVVESQTEPFYQIQASTEPIRSNADGQLEVRVSNAQRLPAGVYEAVLPFRVEYRAVRDAVVAPPPQQERLRITVIKLGRSLNAVEFLDSTGSPLDRLPYGQPWQMAVICDEWTTDSPLPRPTKIDVAATLTFGASDTSANVEYVQLARFQLRQSPSGPVEFQAPPSAPAEWSPLWQNVLFAPIAADPSDSVAVEESERAFDDRENEFRLYNTRTTTLGRGPLTWSDPVLSLRNALLEEPREFESAQWRRTQVLIGFPPIDLLGRITVSAELPDDSLTSTPQSRQIEVAPGFAVIPSVSLVNEPIAFLAAVPEDSPIAQMAFRFTNTSTGESFDMALSPTLNRQGGGRLFSRQAANGNDSIFPLRSSGTWEVTCLDSSATLPADWPSLVRASVPIRREEPSRMLLFAGPRPLIFDAFFGVVEQYERQQGFEIIPQRGWQSSSKADVLRWELVTGVVSQAEMVSLPPVRIDQTVSDREEWTQTGKPRCTLTPAASAEWEPVTSAGHPRQVHVHFTDDISQSAKHLTSDDFSAEELATRTVYYIAPFLLRSEMDDGRTTIRLVKEYVPVSIRNEAYYRGMTWAFLGIAALIVLGFGALFAMARKIRAGNRAPDIEHADPFAVESSLFADDTPGTELAGSTDTAIPLEPDELPVDSFEDPTDRDSLFGTDTANGGLIDDDLFGDSSSADDPFDADPFDDQDDEYGTV